jgi:hypothetical protein
MLLMSCESVGTELHGQRFVSAQGEGRTVNRVSEFLRAKIKGYGPFNTTAFVWNLLIL